MQILQEWHVNCLWKFRKNVTVNIKQDTFITKLGDQINAGILEAEKELSRISFALAEQRFDLQQTFTSLDKKRSSKVDCAILKAFTKFLDLYNGPALVFRPFIVQMKDTVWATRWLNVNNLREPKDELDKLKNLNK